MPITKLQEVAELEWPQKTKTHILRGNVFQSQKSGFWHLNRCVGIDMNILNKLNLLFAFYFGCSVCMPDSYVLTDRPISPSTLPYCWGSLTSLFYNPIYVTTVSQTICFTIAGRKWQNSIVFANSSWSPMVKSSFIAYKVCDFILSKVVLPIILTL